MAIILGKDECLVRCGTEDLRAPDGTPLENVPLYRIVKRSEAGGIQPVPVAEDECLVQLGMVATRGEDRSFQTKGSMFRKMKKSDLHPHTQLDAGEAEACEWLVRDVLAESFGKYVRAMKALERSEKHGNQADRTDATGGIDGAAGGAGGDPGELRHQ